MVAWAQNCPEFFTTPFIHNLSKRTAILSVRSSLPTKILKLDWLCYLLWTTKCDQSEVLQFQPQVSKSFIGSFSLFLSLSGSGSLSRPCLPPKDKLQLPCWILRMKWEELSHVSKDSNSAKESQVSGATYLTSSWPQMYDWSHLSKGAKN